MSVPWLKSLQNGITVKGVHYRSVMATVLSTPGKKKTWLRLRVSEGKNRELRKILGSYHPYPSSTCVWRYY